MKKIISILLVLVMVFSVASCSKPEEVKKEEPKKKEVKKEEKKVETKVFVTLQVSIDKKEIAPIKIELYPDIAPNTVANFVELANKGYYDGLIFHRVIKGFMIQGGDPKGIGTGGPGYSIPGEFTSNGFENNLKHTKGVISMARSNDPNSAGSQFFIMHNDAPHLDGEYAAFGKVIDGLDSVDKIATVETDERDKPIKDCAITKMTVDLNGYEMKKVEKN